MSDFYPEGKKITVAGEEFTVMPYVLRKRTEILRIFADIFIGVSKEMPGLTKEQVLANPEIKNSLFLKLINSAGERMVEIYEKTLNKDREWLLDKVLLKDELAILNAIWEVNDVPFLLEQVRSMAKGLRKTQTQI